MKKLFAARIWASWESWPSHSSFVLYEYQGEYQQNSMKLHKWQPYKRPGVDIYMSEALLSQRINTFRPFCINTTALTDALEQV